MRDARDLQRQHLRLTLSFLHLPLHNNHLPGINFTPRDTPYTTIHHTPPAAAAAVLSVLYTTAHSEARTPWFLQNLPEQAHGFKASETRKYRDCVCELLNWVFKPIDGDGNCFFESVATLLALVPNQEGITQHFLDATDLRARVIEWLRHCEEGVGDVYHQCMVHMHAELAHPLTCLREKRWVTRKPDDLHDYLETSSENGVWVQGRTPTIHHHKHHHHHHISPAYTTAITRPNLPLKQLSQVTTGHSRWQHYSRFVWLW
jgi:hypothetical protein